MEVVQSFEGEDFSMRLLKDGTVLVQGINRLQMLGTGGSDPRLGMLHGSTVEQPTIIPNLRDVIQMAIYPGHALFLHADGTVSASGSNEHGQLGLGNTQIASTPTEIPRLRDVVDVSTNEYHTLFLLANGNVMGTGNNELQQLIETDIQQYRTPILIWNGENVVSVQAGFDESILILNDGTNVVLGLVAEEV